MRSSTIICVGAGVCLWVAGITAGFSALQAYSFAAGRTLALRPGAREFLSAHRAAGRPLIVMAIHPRCSCTDASLAELGDLLARSHGACDALLVQYAPAAATAGWDFDPRPRVLGGVPVPVVADRGGAIERDLGAATSGATLFVDWAGNIRFVGGLTLARDHRGRAPGQDAILAILGGGQPALTSAPVYGCALGPECRPGPAP